MRSKKKAFFVLSAAALILLLGLSLLARRFSAPVAGGTWIGAALAVASSLISYALFGWGLGKSDKVFFKVFGGVLLLRLVAFLGAGAWAYFLGGLGAACLSFVAAFLLLEPLGWRMLMAGQK